MTIKQYAKLTVMVIHCVLVLAPVNALAETREQYIQEFEQSLPTNMEPSEKQSLLQIVSESYTTNPPSSLTLDSRTLGIVGIVASSSIAGIAFYLKKKQG